MRTAPLKTTNDHQTCGTKTQSLRKEISMYCMKKENVLKYFIRPLDQLAVKGKVSFTLCHRTC